MCYVHNQWYDISCANPYDAGEFNTMNMTKLQVLKAIRSTNNMDVVTSFSLCSASDLDSASASCSSSSSLSSSSDLRGGPCPQHRHIHSDAHRH